MITYNTKEDVWSMIGDLYDEAREAHLGSGSDDGDPILDVFHQLPYFCCPNIVLDNNIQKDIQMYQYCEDTKTQPFTGRYGDTPYKWIIIHFTLKNTIGLQHNEMRKKYRRDMERKSKIKNKG